MRREGHVWKGDGGGGGSAVCFFLARIKHLPYLTVSNLFDSIYIFLAMELSIFVIKHV